MHRFTWGETRADGPRRGRWTQAELDHLRDWYGLRDTALLARELARDPESVERRAVLLFKSPPRSGPWTEQELESLKRYLGVASPQVIAAILGRSAEEVSAQIAELRRVRRGGGWSREDKARLKLLYGRRSDADLAVIFSRSVESVRGVARALRLAKDKAFLKKCQPERTTSMPRWTPEALGELRRLYAYESNFALASQLGRSLKSVVSKAHQLGLKKEVERLRAMGRENIRLRYARR